MTTQSSGISSRLPRVSYIKAIDVWMTCCLVFVFGALIEYSIVNVLARKEELVVNVKKDDEEEEDEVEQVIKEADMWAMKPTDVENSQAENAAVGSDSEVHCLTIDVSSVSVQVRRGLHYFPCQVKMFQPSQFCCHALKKVYRDYKYFVFDCTAHNAKPKQNASKWSHSSPKILLLKHVKVDTYYDDINYLLNTVTSILK
jgi:hypothetical protein